MNNKKDINTNYIFKEYRKTATVLAVKMDVEFTVNTIEGVMKGNAGDYLCEGVEKERWPIKKEIFEKSYVLVDKS